MTKLTKQERKTFYKALLKTVCADPCLDHGFCYYISDLAQNMGGKYDELCNEYLYEIDFILIQLPELWKIKPKDKMGITYWFNCDKQGWQKRINKLHNIIQRM